MCKRASVAVADNIAMFPGTPSASVLPVIPAGDWQGKPVPPRMWLVEPWLPMQRATLLTGDGGSGKSLIAQQMATCVALGLPFMGVPTRRANALYITCEDDKGEMHRRQAAISQSLGVPLSELGQKLFLLSRCGDLDNSLLHFSHDGLMLSQFYHQIEATIKAHGIDFLVLDNIAHLFEGNENIRQHVAVFCNALEALCRSSGALTILFLGHPSKAGAQFSGSTAWENQVRSRLYLERPKDDSGCMDDDVRVLSRAKANYARAGDSLTMRWQDWAFVEHDPHASDWRSDLTATGRAAEENDLFLRLLALRDGQGRTVSARPRAPNYAPREFAKMPEARGVKVEQFAHAMERLFSLELIKEDLCKSGADRHSYRRLIAVAGQSKTTPQLFDTHPKERGESAENSCGPVNAGQSCGPVAGQPMTGPHDARQSGGNPRDLDAGQLRAGSGAVGAGGKPPTTRSD